jgi:F-type H+-transporting ATPase subunit a
MLFSPLEQFKLNSIHSFINVFEFFGFYLNNFILVVLVNFFIFMLIISFCTFRMKIMPNPGQFIIESIYDFILTSIISNLGRKGEKYFPYLFLLFLIIFSSNIFGLFPNNLTLTSQILFVFMLSLSTFISIIIIGFFRHGFNFFSIFFPNEAPVYLSFLLVPIEVVSFFSRPFSLSIRLFANMTAGHVLLKVLFGFFFTIAPYITSMIYTSSILEFLAFGSLTTNYGPELFNFFSPYSEPTRHLKLVFFLNFDYISYYYDLYFLPKRRRLSNCYSPIFRHWFELLLNYEFFLNYYLILPIDVFTFAVNILLHGLAIAAIFVLLVFFIILEFFVAILQAYVFFILIIIYLKDAIYLH